MYSLKNKHDGVRLDVKKDLDEKAAKAAKLNKKRAPEPKVKKTGTVRRAVNAIKSKVTKKK